jgi:metal-dependent amidase/aminoacylase/carboxypeptidase family protein
MGYYKNLDIMMQEGYKPTTKEMEEMMEAEETMLEAEKQFEFQEFMDEMKRDEQFIKEYAEWAAEAAKRSAEQTEEKG